MINVQCSMYGLSFISCGLQWFKTVPNKHGMYDFEKINTFTIVIMRLIKRSHTAGEGEIINEDELDCN